MATSSSLSSADGLCESSVLVSHFAICEGECSGYDAGHLEATTWMSKVEQGKAVAMSYAIGDFDRQTYTIGHFKDQVERPVTVQLGGEWDIGGFNRSLATLSRAKKAIWLDQISIKQVPEEIPAQLRRIPYIFGTFEVVVLLPNPPCSCLREALLDPENADDLDDIYLNCLNAFPMSSYQQRLWTKQEFGYSRVISVSYCDVDPAPCSKDVLVWPPPVPVDLDQAFGHMSRYSKYLYHHYLLQTTRYGIRHTGAVWSLMRTHLVNSIMAHALLLLTFHGRGASQIPLKRASYDTAQFLLGQIFQRQKTDLEDEVPLGVILKSSLKATVPEDYVLATFLDTKHYRIPSNLSQMSFRELADDALEQYQKRKQITQFSRLPSGLFEISSSSIKCKPSFYLSSDGTVDNIGDVLGPLETEFRKSLTPVGEVMLRLLARPTGLRSRLSQARSYVDVFGNRSTNDSLKFLRRATESGVEMFNSTIPDPQSILALDIIHGQVEAPQDHWPRPELAQAVFSWLLKREDFGDWQKFPEIDHHKLVYKLMAKWAGIKAETCIARGLGLVVVEEPPCIGFINGMVYQYLRLVETESLTTASPAVQAQLSEAQVFFQRANLLTVSMETNVDRVLAYEAVNLGATFQLRFTDSNTVQHLPLYIVIGVWNYSSRDDHLIGASVADNWAEGNAVLT